MMNSMNEIRASTGFNYNDLIKIQSKGSLLLGIFLTILSVGIIQYLQHGIYKCFSHDDITLRNYRFFDSFYSYSASDVLRVLNRWGDCGIHLYYLIEMVDIFLFMFAYRLLFIVLVNRLFGVIQESTEKTLMDMVRRVIYLPMIVTILDYLEDAAQLLMCLVYQQQLGRVDPERGIWTTIVSVASWFNVTKWNLVAIGLVLLVLLVVWAVYVSIFINKKKDL